jgi:hypothetical protein
MLNPVAAQSMACVCDRSLAAIAGSNPARGIDVCDLWMFCVVRGLCDGPIARPEESYRVWCVWVWSWSLDDEDFLTHYGLLCHKKNYTVYEYAGKIPPRVWQLDDWSITGMYCWFHSLEAYTNVMFFFILLIVKASLRKSYTIATWR